MFGKFVPVCRVVYGKAHFLLLFHNLHNRSEHRLQNGTFRRTLFVQNQLYRLSLKAIRRIEEVLRNAKHTDASLLQFPVNLLPPNPMHFRKELHVFHLSNQGLRHDGFIFIYYGNGKRAKGTGRSPKEEQKKRK